MNVLVVCSHRSHDSHKALSGTRHERGAVRSKERRDMAIDTGTESEPCLDALFSRIPSYYLYVRTTFVLYLIAQSVDPHLLPFFFYSAHVSHKSPPPRHHSTLPYPPMLRCCCLICLWWRRCACAAMVVVVVLPCYVLCVQG